jgi:hypothetical protein
MTKETKQKMYESLKLKYEAQIVEAEATLMIYLENAAGIGEHPQHIEEIVKMTRILAEANDCLETLKETFEVTEGGNNGK